MLTPKAQSHLEQMRQLDRYSRTLGVQIVRQDLGECVAAMRVSTDMANGGGNCHGGAIFSLADVSFAYACNSRGEMNVAAAADIQFVAPCRVGDELTAVATERLRYGRGDRSGLYDVVITNQVGDLIALFTGRAALISS